LYPLHLQPTLASHRQTKSFWRFERPGAILSFNLEPDPADTFPFSNKSNMKLSLEALQVLDAIDRRGSFAGAAAELQRVPSALTYQIQKLEQDLQVQLFDRRGHRAMLTEAGRQLLTEGRVLLRAADELESHVRRIATGWEVALRIALDEALCSEVLLPVIDAFYGERATTHLRLACEPHERIWAALADRRADLVIGAAGDAPAGSRYSSRPLGEMEWVYAVAPHHPLAQEPEPISRTMMRRHRAVTVGETSRNPPPRAGQLPARQDVLVVADLRTQLAAQAAGLGGGFLPRHVAQASITAGRLIAKAVEDGPPCGTLRYAWRRGENGKALKWFRKRLEAAALRRALCGG
jgi:DNA-binding transcriptional LysR family regulator